MTVFSFKGFELRQVLLESYSLDGSWVPRHVAFCHLLFLFHEALSLMKGVGKNNLMNCPVRNPRFPDWRIAEAEVAHQVRTARTMDLFVSGAFPNRLSPTDHATREQMSLACDQGHLSLL